MRYLWICLIAFIHPALQAQVISAIHAEKDSIGIGEPLVLQFSMTVPESCMPASIALPHPDSILNLWNERDTMMMDRYADWEIMDAGEFSGKIDNNHIISWSALGLTASNGVYSVKITLKIILYGAGLFRFEPAGILCTQNTEYQPGPGIDILVTPPAGVMQGDSISLAPIRPIYTEPVNMEDLLPWIAGTAVLLLLGGLLYYLLRKRQKVSSPPATVEPTEVLLPHEKALKALQQLKEKQLWQQGWVKEYQTELTRIIRQYIEDRFKIPALEMTTGEIRQEMLKSGMESPDVHELNEILSIADLVKFAKASPDTQIHEKFHDMAVRFVEKTKNRDTDS
ncbi:MAG: hypothetical protein IPM26_04105 [Saprospiraceae bacterium]|nr:hypothetical protein [Saprospiraceae bacterium]